MKFRIIDTRTNEDVTNRACWQINPDGTLAFTDGNDLDSLICYQVIFTSTLPLKPLEWIEEKGFLVAYCFDNKFKYWLNLARMDLRLYDATYYAHKIMCGCCLEKNLDTSNYDSQGWESPLNYCKRMAAEHREKLILGEM